MAPVEEENAKNAKFSGSAFSLDERYIDLSELLGCIKQLHWALQTVALFACAKIRAS